MVTDLEKEAFRKGKEVRKRSLNHVSMIILIVKFGGAMKQVLNNTKKKIQKNPESHVSTTIINHRRIKDKKIKYSKPRGK